MTYHMSHLDNVKNSLTFNTTLIKILSMRRVFLPTLDFFFSFSSISLKMRWRIAGYCILWGAGAYLCARLDPGAVQLFITLTIFILIARNLGHRQGGLSAYSVFNRGYMPLLGQLRPEQFENEIRHRPVDGDFDVTPQNDIDSSRHVPRRHTAPNSRFETDEHDAILARVRADMQSEMRSKRRTVQTETGGSSLRRRR